MLLTNFLVRVLWLHSLDDGGGVHVDEDCLEGVKGVVESWLMRALLELAITDYVGKIDLGDHVGLGLAELEPELDGEREVTDSGVVAGVVVLKVRSFSVE